MAADKSERGREADKDTERGGPGRAALHVLWMLQGCALIGRELFASWLNPWILNPAATIQRE